MRPFTAILVNLLFAFGLAGAAAPAATRNTPASVHAATPNDADIDSTLRAKLAKSKIGKDGFKYHVSRGVVTWEGSTAVIQHKGSATRMARTSGASKVVNNIQITGGAKPFGSLKKAAISQ